MCMELYIICFAFEVRRRRQLLLTKKSSAARLFCSALADWKQVTVRNHDFDVFIVFRFAVHFGVSIMFALDFGDALSTNHHIVGLIISIECPIHSVCSTNTDCIRILKLSGCSPCTE